MSNSYDSLEIGQSFAVERLLTAEDVRMFADVTGDDNPIHLDASYASGTRFGQPIVHGVLLLGVISKVLGRDFPGPGSVAVSLSARFLRPVPVGSTVTVEATVAEKIERYRHVRLRVTVYIGKKTAVAGEAVLIPPGEGAL